MGYWEIVVGGTPLNLDSFGCYVEAVQGAGVPPLNNVSLDYAQGDGAFYQQTFAKTRTLTLQLYVPGSSLANLHALRRALWDALKPNRVPVQQPLVLRYSGGGTRTVQLNAVYDSGLEWTQLEGFSERLPLRFIAYDPFWFETTTTTTALSVQTSISNANSILQRSATGQWSALSTGMNAAVYCLLQDNAGNIYAGGAFTTPANRIAKWDGTAWSALSTGLNAAANCLAIGPDGSVYVGGSFTTPYPGIAKWNGTAWSALGSGITGYVLDMKFHPDGKLYIVGYISLDGGATYKYAAVWNGATWSSFGTLSAGPTRLVIGPDGALYTSTTPASNAGVARWNGTAWVSLGEALDGASPGFVGGMAFGVDGYLYIAGKFTSIGGVTAASTARWNGAGWQALGTGLSGVTAANNVLCTPNGDVTVVGVFTTAGGLTLSDSIARWNGSAWFYPDIDLPGSASVYALIMSASGKTTLGFSTTGTATAAAITSVTNTGTADAFPVVTLTGPGTIYQLVNATTGDVLYFNLTLNAGETVTLDLTPGVKSFTSSWRGNIITTLLPGSELASFRLAPGANALSLFSANPATTASISWVNRHWSLDGSA